MKRNNIDNLDIASPLIKQYVEIQSKYQDAILVYRVGDFLEIIGDNAKIISDVLGTILTKRIVNSKGNILQMTGFHYSNLDTYLIKLTKAGLKVALVDYVISE